MSQGPQPQRWAKGAIYQEIHTGVVLGGKVGCKHPTPRNPLPAHADNRRAQFAFHEVIEAPGKVILHVRSSTQNRHLVFDNDTDVGRISYGRRHTARLRYSLHRHPC